MANAKRRYTCRHNTVLEELRRSVLSGDTTCAVIYITKGKENNKFESENSPDMKMCSNNVYTVVKWEVNVRKYEGFA